jgi:hypothetical protein
MQSDADINICQDYHEIVHLTNPEAQLSITLSWDKRRSLSLSAQRLLQYVQEYPISAWHLSSPDPTGIMARTK